MPEQVPVSEMQTNFIATQVQSNPQHEKELKEAQDLKDDLLKGLVKL